MKRLFSTRNLIILAVIVAIFVVSALLGLKVPPPEVSIAAEPIFNLGPLAVTNSLLSSWVAMLILIVLSLVATRRIPRDLEHASNKDLVPSGFQNFMEWVVEYFHRMVKEISGPWASTFFPIVMTIFLFVIVSNWLELIPGVGSIGKLVAAEAGQQGLVTHGAILTAEEAGPGHGSLLIPLFRSPSADLNFTIALAVLTQVLSQYFGIKAAKGTYLKRFFDLSGFKNGPVVGIAQSFAGVLELISEFTKIISFSFRLFGNIFAGEVLLTVIAFLVPYIASLPFYGLELFVGFIQAAVFMLLALVFFTSAVSVHGGSQERHAG